MSLYMENNSYSTAEIGQWHKHTWILIGKPCASQIALLFEEANVGDPIPPLNGAPQCYARESCANTGELAVCGFFRHLGLLDQGS